MNNLIKRLSTKSSNGTDGKVEKPIHSSQEKIDHDINEMEISLDHSNKANAEMAKVIKRLAGNLLEIDSAVEEESRARADIEDQAGIAERKGKYEQWTI